MQAPKPTITISNTTHFPKNLSTTRFVRLSFSAHRSLDVETGQAPDAKDRYNEDYDDEFYDEDDYEDEDEDQNSDYNVSTITNRNGSRITISTPALEEQVRTNSTYSTTTKYLSPKPSHLPRRRPPFILLSSSASPSNTTCTHTWKQLPKVSNTMPTDAHTPSSHNSHASPNAALTQIINSSFHDDLVAYSITTFSELVRCVARSNQRQGVRTILEIFLQSAVLILQNWENQDGSVETVSCTVNAIQHALVYAAFDYSTISLGDYETDVTDLDLNLTESSVTLTAQQVDSLTR
jgi:hypothetical protein